jgi:hypothetical protein
MRRYIKKNSEVTAFEWTGTKSATIIREITKLLKPINEKNNWNLSIRPHGTNKDILCISRNFDACNTHTEFVKIGNYIVIDAKNNELPIACFSKDFLDKKFTRVDEPSLEKYSDHGDPTNLSKEDLAKINWTKYKIVVPTEKDKEDLMEAFEHIHYSDIDTDLVTVNQLAHEYLDEERMEGAKNNIVVNEEIFNQLNKNE